MDADKIQLTMAWAEDRALLGSNPSADPGAKTEGRAAGDYHASAPLLSFGIGTKAKNPSATELTRRTITDAFSFQKLLTNGKRFSCSR